MLLLKICLIPDFMKGEKKMDNWFDKHKFFESLLVMTWVFFLFFCLFLLSFTSHGATIDEFDQYYPIHQNQDANGDSFYNTAILDYIDNYFDNENNYIISYFSNYHSNGQKVFYVYVINKQAGFYGELKTDIRYFQIYSIGSGQTAHAYGLIISDDGSNPYVWASTDSVFYNLGYSNCYASNFILYTNNNPETQRVLLLWGDVEEGDVFTGHATPPDPYVEPILAQGSNYTLPHEVPESPTINNYTWITYAPPTVDNSTLENLLESLVDIVKYNATYISTNVSNEFNTLITAIKELGDYIVKTIQYYVGLVNDNIKNGFTNLYDNIVKKIFISSISVRCNSNKLISIRTRYITFKLINI